MPAATRIAIAVVECQGHVLVGQRGPAGPLPGLSEFPGGKCDSDETPQVCAVRECREETGLLVLPREHLMTVSHKYDHDDLELHFWRCRLAADVSDLAEPSAPFRWVAKEELARLDFPEANEEVLKILTQPGR